MASLLNHATPTYVKNGTVIKCATPGCKTTIVVRSSSHRWCAICYMERKRAQMRESARSSYHLRKKGIRTLNSEVKCKCGVAYIKTNPMQKRCLRCQTTANIRQRLATERRRLERRKSESARRWAVLICKCGTSYKPDPGTKPVHCVEKYCPRCHPIVRKCYGLVSRIKKRDGITIKWTSLYALYLRQNRKCAVSGIEMTGEGLKVVSADRIDNSKRHTLSNIQLVCKWINLARQHHSIAELKTVLQEFRNTENDL
jgi:hypothetical protein